MIVAGRSWGVVGGMAAVFAVLSGSAQRAPAHLCETGTFSSTFKLLEKAIFEDRSCTNSLCHGAANAGGLDLRSGVAYENLIDRDSVTVPGTKRVVPGQKEKSLLWLNLAAKTLPDVWKAPLRAMPLDPVPPLNANELEALRLWIEDGAPKDAVVPGTDDLLDACLPPEGPISIKPLDPPAPGTGVQIHMPRWVLLPESEREVCFASYYDVSDQVPPEFRGPDGTTFRYRRNVIRQDPLSHHLIVNLYRGRSAPDASVWGVYRCRGGQRDGQLCNPKEIGVCGAGSDCGTTPVNTIACIGFGPPDAGIGISSSGIGGTQEAAAEFDFPDGVYGELPLKGVIMWNSHAFNLTAESGKLEAWLNFEFAAPEQQRTPVQQIFNAEEIFKTNAPAFGTDEVCSTEVLPPDARLFELSFHYHKRGARARVFAGAWRCQGGPNAGDACTPFGPDRASPDLCAGSPCGSTRRPRVGDCNLDGAVTVNELVTGVNIALGVSSIEACHEDDDDGDWTVSVSELVTAVNAALNGVPDPVARGAEESVLLTTYIYNDPVVARFSPQLVWPGGGSAAGERSLTFCALYDNGYDDPSTVKRRSTSPPPPLDFPNIGGPCALATGCTEGKVGIACVGATDEERDASCDSSPGSGDGMCDACPLFGGVTTEDEMFILLGQYYLP